MRLDGPNLRNVYRYVAIVAAIGFAGCGDTCIVGFVNSGMGVVIVGAANTSPPCSLKQTRAAMNVVALKSAVCETCTTDARVEHVFVTVQGIQLHPAGTDDASKDWLEIAPELTNQRRQMDLVGNSLPERLVENANIPAETYRELRLRFCSIQESRTNDACGGTLPNCIVMADGRVEPLRWPGDTPELVIPIRTDQGDTLAVLPDSIVDLRLSLEVQQAFTVSSIQRSRLQNVVVGHATAVRRWNSIENDNAGITESAKPD
jgi:Domain of unknown function (DUF4382)